MSIRSKMRFSVRFSSFLYKLVLIGVFLSIFSLLLGKIGLIVLIGALVGLYYWLKYRTVKKAMKEQLRFMLSKRKVRSVNMVVGRWGDFIYVNCFGIFFAAAHDDSEEIRNMIYDIAILTKTLRTSGKLPKGKFYSEMTAYYVKNLGLDAETIKWKCYTDVYTVVDYLFRLKFTVEANMMSDWVNAISIELKNQGRTVYHRSFIVRVIENIEKLSADMQIEARKTGMNQ